MSKRQRNHAPQLASTSYIPGDQKRFAQITESILISEAFHSLSLNGTRLLLFMLNDKYCNAIKPPYIEEPEARFTHADFYFPQAYVIKKYHITSKRAITDSLRDLIDKGFIVVIREGSRSGNGTGGNQKTKSVYRFSEDWKIWKKL